MLNIAQKVVALVARGLIKIDSPYVTDVVSDIVDSFAVLVEELDDSIEWHTYLTIEDLASRGWWLIGKIVGALEGYEETLTDKNLSSARSTIKKALASDVPFYMEQRDIIANTAARRHLGLTIGQCGILADIILTKLYEDLEDVNGE